MSNAECCKDYKQKKKLNDASFGKNERIRVSAYGTKKKEKLLSMKKRVTKQKYKFEKRQKQMSRNNNMEVVALINIANS